MNFHVSLSINDIRIRLSDYRFGHVCRVRDTALAIGMAWRQTGIDIDLHKLETAALLHDVAKEDELLLQDTDLHARLMWGRELIGSKSLLHAALGAYLAETTFGITDAEILRAIAYHPTGHPEFEVVGEALYLADFMEPGRPYCSPPEQTALLQLAKADRIAALVDVCHRKRAKVEEKGRIPHPLSHDFESSLLARRSA